MNAARPNTRSVLLAALLSSNMSCGKSDAGQTSYEGDADVEASNVEPESAEREHARWPMPDASEGAATKPMYEVGEKIVTDSVTHLIWQREIPAVYQGCTASDSSFSPPDSTKGTRCTWEEAKRYCRSAALGAKDWRLPSRVELESLHDHTRGDPLNDESVIPTIDASVFPNTAAESFWTTTIHPGRDDSAWTVNFRMGTSYGGGIDTGYLVRCVASAESEDLPQERYDVMSRLVRDRHTGLTWQRFVDPDEYRLLDAETYCKYLDLEGGGWRLPTLKELITLVDPTHYGPAIDSKAFPLTPTDRFWTATVPSKTRNVAGSVSFSGGDSSFDPDNYEYRIRCVR